MINNDESIHEEFEFLKCVRTGQLPQIERILDINPSFLSQILNHSGQPEQCLAFSALHLACCIGLIPVIELLLSRGAVVNIANQWDETPLHNACYEKQEAVITLLIGAGADVNITDIVSK